MRLAGDGQNSQLSRGTPFDAQDSGDGACEINDFDKVQDGDVWPTLLGTPFAARFASGPET
jgi:hypothetical protein